MSTVLEQRIQILSSHTDMFGRLRSSVLARLLQDAAIVHAEELGVGRDVGLEKDALWVITHMAVEVEKLPQWGQEITLRTWPGVTRHGLFPRYFEMLGSDGERLLRASTIWLLMHARERHMLNPKTIGMEVSGENRDGQLPLPSRRVPFPAELTGREERTVRYSETDVNRHMNNTRYLDWADDLLPLEFHENHVLRKLWVEYRSEILPGQTVTLRSEQSDNALCLVGDAGEKEAFKVRADYDSLSK